MDTEKVFKEQKIVEQPIQVEKQEDTIGQDWVKVDSEWSVGSQIQKFKIAEGVSIDAPEVQKVMEDLVLYSHTQLSKDDLKNATKDEIREDKAVKVADLKNYSLDELTDWALRNAKVRGADSSFIKLVENLLDIQNLSRNMSTCSSYETMGECRKQLDIALGALGTNVTSYHDSHNKFIVFSEKGKLRLELCRVLQNKLDNGLLGELRNKADMEANALLLRLDGEDKREELVRRVRLRQADEIATFAELRKNTEVDKFEKKVAHHSGVINRGQLAPLFKGNVPGAKEWNEKVLKAIGEYNKSGKEEVLDGIIKDVVEEVANFKFVPEMADLGYAIEHPDELFEMFRLSKFFGDFQDNGTFDFIPQSFERVLRNNRRLMGKFHIIGDLQVKITNLYSSTFSQIYGVHTTSMLEGEQAIKPEYESLDEINYQDLFELSEQYRKEIVGMDTTYYYNLHQTPVKSRDYYYEKYHDKFSKLPNANSEDYNRALGQTVLLVERDSKGTPIEEDKDNAELNERYINSLMTGDAMECAETCYELIEYGLKNRSVLLDVGTDLDKYYDNFKIYSSCQGLFLNLMSISFGPKKQFINFSKSKDAPEEVKKLFDAFDEINQLSIFQNMILKDKLVLYGIAMETGSLIEARDLSKTSSIKSLNKEYQEMLAAYHKSHDGEKSQSFISKEDFLNAFKQYLEKQQADKK